MAVVTTKSAGITNRDATPVVLTNAYLARAEVKKAAGLVTAVSGDSIASKYIFCSIPSNALVHSVQISCPDIGTTGAMDIGLYQTTANGSAVVDADFFKAAQSVSGGALTKTEVLYGNIVTVANAEKRVWEALGLTVDPQIDYDVVGTLTAAQDAGGAIMVEVYYSI